VTYAVALACTLPWVLSPLVTVLRARNSRSLAEDSPNPASDAPSVAIVVPARNEAHNIERCVRSALRSAYPRLEVIAVDDHSTDGTGDILRAIAATDPRLRVVEPPPLPAGWFGKQWACATGAATTTADIIGFLDADTWQEPDLIPRVVSAIRSRDADFLTVLGRQEMGSFWERMIQPQMFSIMLTRFGGTESVNESRSVTHKIANGQCIFVRRAGYEALGGHAAVRDRVAEDLALAQMYFNAGKRAVVVLGLDQLTTRMYTSLRELVEGWGKNIFVAGREAMPGGALGRVFYPLALVLPALWSLVPAVTLVLAIFGVFGTSVLVWAATVTAINLLWWIGVYAWLRLSPVYALLHPLGSAVLFYIALRSIRRGGNVSWKQRDYTVTVTR
jgi:chlorobactene glucosyltransferase